MKIIEYNHSNEKSQDKIEPTIELLVKITDYYIQMKHHSYWLKKAYCFLIKL